MVSEHASGGLRDGTDIANVRDGVEGDGGKDVWRSSKKHSVDLVVTESLDDRGEEVDNGTHSLAHACVLLVMVSM